MKEEKRNVPTNDQVESTGFGVPGGIEGFKNVRGFVFVNEIATLMTERDIRITQIVIILG